MCHEAGLPVTGAEHHWWQSQVALISRLAMLSGARTATGVNRSILFPLGTVGNLSLAPS